MTLFFVFALLLSAVVAAMLLPPLWRKCAPASGTADRKTANLSIFRDQLAELEREKAEGALAEADFTQARSELQRRLLEEVEPESAATGRNNSTPSRKLALALVIALPLLALLAYGVLGNPRALDPTQRVAAPRMTPAEIEGMVGRLAEKLKANPDDLKGWLMLARSYKTMGRFGEAAEAYGKGEKAIGDDPDVLASYAETLAMAGGKGLQGKPLQLVDRALKIDPRHGHSLFLAGAAAMEAGDARKGIAYWEALLPQVEPGSEIDQLLRQGIEKMKQAK